MDAKNQLQSLEPHCLNKNKKQSAEKCKCFNKVKRRHAENTCATGNSKPL